MEDLVAHAPFPPPMPEPPVPTWSIEDPAEREGHTCTVVVTTPIPSQEDIEWEWEWGYVWITLEQQLGEVVKTWDLMDDDSWAMSDDGLKLFLFLRPDDPSCKVCEEAERLAAYLTGTQGQLL